jgi:hypothetical protein
MVVKSRKRMKSKLNTTRNNNSSENHTYYKNNPWDKYGKVYDKKTKKFFRLGSDKSANIIKNMTKNNEWRERVEFMSQKNNKFGNKMKSLL